MRLLKPLAYRFTRWINREDKRKAKAREKRLQQQAEAFAWQLQRVAVYERDEHHCKVCGRRVWLSARNPFEVMHAHHIAYRSAGGSDELINLLCLCAECHNQEHLHLINIEGTSEDFTVEWLVA